MSQKQIALVDLKLKAMLRKGSIMRIQPAKGEFLSNLFLVGKNDRGYHPVINFKRLNQFIPFLHFKMEDLSQLKHIIQDGHWMCKLDLKDAYFSLPLEWNLRKFVRFQWKGTLYEFMCPCFGLHPAPSVFTKLLKISVSLLKKINIRVITYFDDMLILSYTIREAHMRQDALIYLLQNLDFIINIKKINDFVIDTSEGTKNRQDFSEPSQESFCNSSGIDKGCGSPIIYNTSSGICKDSVKVFSATTNCVSKEKKWTISVITLNTKSRKQLTWWIENLRFCNGQTFSQLNPQVIIQTDASLAGWGAVCNGVQTSEQWSEEERTLDINVPFQNY